jgi:hypothetical protein
MDAEKIARGFIDDLGAAGRGDVFHVHRYLADNLGAALTAAYNEGVADAVKVVDEWKRDLKLRAGEMTAGEERTARAVLGAVSAAIWRLKK